MSPDVRDTTAAPDLAARRASLAAPATELARKLQEARKLAGGFQQLPGSQQERLRRAVLSARDVEGAQSAVAAVCGRPAYRRPADPSGSRGRLSEEIPKLLRDLPDLDSIRAVVHELVERARATKAIRDGDFIPRKDTEPSS